jgi:glycosyltransferase involved in cell wall biosynthesis
VRRDLVYMRSAGYGTARRIGWSLRSARHHAGRGLFAALGSRADRMPPRARAALSLERRPDAPRPPGFAARISPKSPRPYGYEYIRASHRREPEPLVPPARDAGGESMHIAWVVPPFDRGSGGHMTIFTLIAELERRGHRCSIWIHDPGGKSPGAERQRADIIEYFVPVQASVHVDLEGWQGADVALATGWQTAYPVRDLPSCSLKAYLVQDYEPHFFGASAQRLWAEATYGMGFPCIAASPWLSDLMRDRYGTESAHFELGVDFDTYRKLDQPREPQTIVYYARPSTPRRATELGVLALEEVRERHPDCRIVMFGDVRMPWAPFQYEAAGVVTPELLARLYNRATVGLVISLTNYSRMPKEMMACGLPVVDVDHPSVISVFGSDGDVIRLAKPDPILIADRVCELLEDAPLRAAVGNNARRFVDGMTWSAAAEQIESSLREWLVRQWSEAAAAAGS